MLRVPLRRITGRAGYWLEFRVVLVVVAVPHRRLGPSSSTMTSTVERVLPSSAVQLRCWSRPRTRLYDLWHTAASLMIRQGASVKAVQRQLGHATASITLDT